MKRKREETENGLNQERAAASRLLYAFSYEPAFELESVRQSKTPTHRLWGFMELVGRGWRAELSPRSPWWWKLLGATGWRVWQTLWLLKEEKSAAAVVAVHEISAIMLLAMRALGWRGVPLVVLNMGILHPKNCSGYRLWVWRWLLPLADRVVSVVDANGGELTRLFGVDASRTVFLPMAVDSDFLGRACAETEEDFVLAVGTNDGKDFGTLLEALPLGRRLVVVTDSYNARKVRDHWCFGPSVEVLEAVSAENLRELYRKSAIVVVPLADTPHGSGHTVLLETMAMGKIVVVSASRSMRDYTTPCGAVLSVPVGAVPALRAALEEALQRPERFMDMRERAVAQVRSKFDVRHFGEGLERIIKEIVVTQSAGDAGTTGAVRTNNKEGEKNHAFVS
jgi:glycosyltransferase involved in cell wall biosynthesis